MQAILLLGKFLRFKIWKVYNKRVLYSIKPIHIHVRTDSRHGIRVDFG
jgi:hypothetical protein